MKIKKIMIFGLWHLFVIKGKKAICIKVIKNEKKDFCGRF